MAETNLTFEDLHQFDDRLSATSNAYLLVAHKTSEGNYESRSILIDVLAK